MVSSKHDLLFFNQYEVEHKVDNILSQNNLYITLNLNAWQFFVYPLNLYGIGISFKS